MAVSFVAHHDSCVWPFMILCRLTGSFVVLFGLDVCFLWLYIALSHCHKTKLFAFVPKNDNHA